LQELLTTSPEMNRLWHGEYEEDEVPGADAVAS
jgi:hypothetical protein